MVNSSSTTLNQKLL